MSPRHYWQDCGLRLMPVSTGIIPLRRNQIPGGTGSAFTLPCSSYYATTLVNIFCSQKQSFCTLVMLPRLSPHPQQVSSYMPGCFITSLILAYDVLSNKNCFFRLQYFSLSCYLQYHIQVWERGINWDRQPRQSSSALVSAQAVGGFDSLIQGSSLL